MSGELITPGRYAGLVASARSSVAPWLEFEPETLRSSYTGCRSSSGTAWPNTRCSPSTRCSRCAGACRSGLSSHGAIPIDAHFDSSLSPLARRSLTLDDAIKHFEQRQAYICIFNPESDPDYRPVIEGLLGEVAAHTEALDPAITWYATYVFISARESVTPYHMDREMNFLMQVRGTKTVRLWDPSDAAIMTAPEKDYLFTGTPDSRPTCRPAFEARAMIYELCPGPGVHHPFIAPHLVHTGPDLLISFALTFRTRQSDVWSAAHRCSHYLRKMWLRPGPVGRHRVLDGAKAGLMRMTGRSNREGRNETK